MRPYTDSVVVTKTVRAVVPFVLTFGLFTLLHGTSSVGGGFQGGVILGAAVVTVAFGFGLDQTWRVLDKALLTALSASGVLVFGAVAYAGLVVGGSFLRLDAFPVPKSTVYATELVEVGIGATVAGVVVVLFFELAGGTDRSAGNERAEGTDEEGGDRR
jgi:multicomponent Na+:H+ antiporter subunit B